MSKERIQSAAILLLVFLVSTNLFFWFLSRWPELGWTEGVLATLTVLLANELIKRLLGYEQNFNKFDHRDKIVYFVALTIPLLLQAFYEKEDIAKPVGIGLVIMGIMLSWLIVRFFGSKHVKRIFSRWERINDLQSEEQAAHAESCANGN